MTPTQEQQLLKCTSLIHTEKNDGSSQQATCFFIKRTTGNVEHHYLVTCAHVLEDSKKISIYLDYYQTDKVTHYKKITLSPNGAIRFHKDYDLALLCIDSIPNKNCSEDYYFYSPIDISMIPLDFDSFSSFQSLLMLGYPSGFHDNTTNLPIVRKSITSTPLYSSYKGKNEFLINIPFLDGSSGSPIFTIQHDVPYLVGMEYSKLVEKITLDRKENRLYRSQKYKKEIETGLGIAIRSDSILDLF